MSEFSENFKKAYKERYEYFYKNEEQKRELEALEDEICFLGQCIDKASKTSSVYPMILGNSFYRISITNIGTFPPYKYTPKIIYPVKYTSKKRYKSHTLYKKPVKDKVLYICSIEIDGFRIVADDGFVWSGDKCWEEFTESVKCNNEYKSFEEFSGLLHPSVTKLVEKIGDISKFRGYIPYDERKSNSIEEN